MTKRERIVVTGATSGIGLETVRKLAREGRRVAALGRNSSALKTLTDEFSNVDGYEIDLANDAEIAPLVARIAETFGTIDGVVSAAGIVKYTDLEATFGDELHSLFQVNAVAPMLLTQQLLPFFSKSAGIVFVSSTLATRAAPKTFAYSASKAALNAIARSLALQLAPRGICVNVVAPGITDTPMVPKDRQEALAHLHPLGRVGQPSEIADAIISLLDAPWTTGALLAVDGGLLIRE